MRNVFFSVNDVSMIWKCQGTRWDEASELVSTCRWRWCWMWKRKITLLSYCESDLQQYQVPPNLSFSVKVMLLMKSLRWQRWAHFRSEVTWSYQTDFDSIAVLVEIECDMWWLMMMCDHDDVRCSEFRVRCFLLSNFNRFSTSSHVPVRLSTDTIGIY